jgi:hypothetical protein
MEEYLRRYATLDPFYRILFQGALFIGLLAIFFGLVTGNIVFLGLGAVWILGGLTILTLVASTDES